MLFGCLEAEQRRRCMARIRVQNTKPAVLLRKALWHRGSGYRLHDVPSGTPDFVLPQFRAVVGRAWLFLDGPTARYSLCLLRTLILDGQIDMKRERDVARWRRWRWGVARMHGMGSAFRGPKRRRG